MLFDLLHMFYSTVGSDSFSLVTAENTMNPSGRIAEVSQSHVLYSCYPIPLAKDRRLNVMHLFSLSEPFEFDAAFFHDISLTNSSTAAYFLV